MTAIEDARALIYDYHHAERGKTGVDRHAAMRTLAALVAEHERLTAPAEHPLDALWDGTPSTARAIANAKAQERLTTPLPGYFAPKPIAGTIEASLTSPPTDDEREALIDDLSATVDWLKRTRNYMDADRVMRAIAALRRQGAITDERTPGPCRCGGCRPGTEQRAALEAALTIYRTDPLEPPTGE